MTCDAPAQRFSLRTTDFCELQEALVDWDQDYDQLSPGAFTGSLEMIRTDTTEIFRERWGRKVRYRGTTPPGAFGFALALQPPGLGNWMGREGDLDTVILQAPGHEADLVAPPSWDALVLSVAEPELRHLMAALSGEPELSNSLHGTIAIPNAAAQSLRRSGLDLLRQTNAMAPATQAEIATLSQRYVQDFVWEVVKAKQSGEFFLDRTKHAGFVEQATEFTLTDHGGRAGLVDICSHLNVSLRSLHYAFEDVVGLSPATWLRRIRLNRVHDVLRQSAPNDVLVQDVAKSFGFMHLGHFAEQYRRLFGLLPMQTLSQS